MKMAHWISPFGKHAHLSSLASYSVAAPHKVTRKSHKIVYVQYRPDCTCRVFELQSALRELVVPAEHTLRIDGLDLGLK